MASDRFYQFQSVFLPAVGSERRGAWQPLLDIYQTREGWLLKADLAGVRPEDVSIVVEGTHLTIQGLRRDWTLEEGCCQYSMEIAYSRFERIVELPDDLTHAAIDTAMRDGMLLIRIRRGE